MIRALAAWVSGPGRALALLGVMLLCSGCAAPPAPPQPGVFRFNLGTEPPTLDWSRATDATSFDVILQLMDGLTQFEPDLSLRPALARSWTVEGTTITFHLRDDVVWTDGVPFRARDVEYAWKRLLDPRLGAEYAYFLYDIVNAEEYNTGRLADAAQVGVQAVNDHTLVVRLTRPVAYFVSLTTFMVTFPLRRDVVERHRERWTEPEHIVTLGPFRLARWAHEREIVLAPNPRYYGPPPKVREVRLLMVNEASTALTLYERGELDVADRRSLPAADIPRYRGTPEFYTHPVLRTNYYGVNVTKTPFTDVRVRRAFAHAIDRRVFPKILQGGEVPLSSWIPPGLLGHNPAIGLPYDPDRARALLADAGYPGGRGFPPVTLVYNTDEANQLVAEALQAMWKQTLGVPVRVENLEWKVFLKRIREDPPHLFRLGWGADIPDPDNFMSVFLSASGNNNTRWQEPRYDALVIAARVETDPRRRAALYDQAQRLLTEEAAAIIPLYVSTVNLLIKPHVRGLYFNLLNMLTLRTTEVLGPS